jgi:hypothetical protein
VLRSRFTNKRNRATSLRRRGEDTTQAREQAHQARSIYLNEVEKQKKQHWKDFLDNPDNIWKAASYAKPTGPSMEVPELTTNGQRYQSDEEKAKILMATFFPTPLAPEATGSETAEGSTSQSIRWPSLTKHEVERAIFKSNPDKAPGPDEISFRVWREL